MATASTDLEGAWFKELSTPAAGDYYAIAAQVVLQRPGHRHTCAAARTNTVTLVDTDGDKVIDPLDNCPAISNQAQDDADGDGRGDACDADADGDGATVSAGDCDDLDATRYPGALENTADGIDNDCDGAIDEGFSASPEGCWFPSSTTIGPDTTWTQAEGATSTPCEYRLTVYETILPDSVFFFTDAYYYWYRPTGPGDPVAFIYNQRAWTYYATGSNCCAGGD